MNAYECPECDKKSLSTPASPSGQAETCPICGNVAAVPQPALLPNAQDRASFTTRGTQAIPGTTEAQVLATQGGNMRHKRPNIAYGQRIEALISRVRGNSPFLDRLFKKIGSMSLKARIWTCVGIFVVSAMVYTYLARVWRSPKENFEVEVHRYLEDDLHPQIDYEQTPSGEAVTVSFVMGWAFTERLTAAAACIDAKRILEAAREANYDCASVRIKVFRDMFDRRTDEPRRVLIIDGIFLRETIRRYDWAMYTGDPFAAADSHK